MQETRKGFLLLGVLLALSACGSPPVASEEEKEEVLLARVYDKTLYLSELEGMFPSSASPQDSQNIIQSYANRWVQEALILHEAERNTPEDLDLEKLVEDYRASLLRHSYEEQLVSNEMDSMVTEEELQTFYEKNKEQYQLETPIIRCYFIKVPQPVPDLPELRRLWNNNEDPESLQALIQYCSQYAEAHILEDSTWHRVDDIALQLPKGTLTRENAGNRRSLSLSNDNYLYYLRIFEVKKDREISPLSYIQDQARRAILHSRKVSFLEQQKRDLYEREIRKGSIHTYY
jgi:hypothetical protein